MTRRILWEQESDLTAVGHETLQKLRRTTIDTRVAAVSSSDVQHGAGMGLTSGIGYTGIIKLQQTLDKIQLY